MIRAATDADWPLVWPIFEEVVAAGDAYPYPPDIGEADARAIWMAHDKRVYLALDDAGKAIGTYYLRPNQPGLGDHVCNAGYMVAASARGRGLGRAMCLHSLGVAQGLGYAAMQYNLVVASNDSAVRLWQAMGFAIVGTVPRAFRHARLGLVDAHVMYRDLAAEAKS